MSLRIMVRYATIIECTHPRINGNAEHVNGITTCRPSSSPEMEKLLYTGTLRVIFAVQP